MAGLASSSPRPAAAPRDQAHALRRGRLLREDPGKQGLVLRGLRPVVAERVRRHERRHEGPRRGPLETREARLRIELKK